MPSNDFTETLDTLFMKVGIILGIVMSNPDVINFMTAITKAVIKRVYGQLCHRKLNLRVEAMGALSMIISALSAHADTYIVTTREHDFRIYTHELFYAIRN